MNDYLTREQVHVELLRLGLNVSERTLRNWATRKRIPHPVRRLPPGATDGLARALFRREDMHAIIAVAESRPTRPQYLCLAAWGHARRRSHTDVVDVVDVSLVYTTSDGMKHTVPLDSMDDDD